LEIHVSFESNNQTVYIQVCNSKVQIEIEAASYTPCPFVQARAAAKTNRYSVLDRLANSDDAAVLINILENPTCKAELAQRIALRVIASVRSADKFNDLASQWASAWRALVIHNRVRFEERTLIEDYLRKWDQKPPRPVVGYQTDERLALLTLQEPKQKCERLGVLTSLGWRNYAKHWSPKVRVAVICHKDCPDEILRSFLKDSNWLVYLRAWYKLVIENRW
jgi:hypothetical protein